nr:P-loop NTPase [Pseudomonas aeruginosa]
MSAITRQTVEATLRQYQDPYLNQDPVSAGCLREVEIQGDRVRVRLELGYAAGLFRRRGPMVSGALIQLITQTAWDNLDYLVVDMPPGTGDIQLTLAQKVPVAGAVIVTTPQDLALLDAKKGVEMFRKVNIPVLGVVENMAVHICSNCGHAEHLFGEGGGAKLAAQFGVELLASMPLSIAIRTQADSGRPTVIADPESQLAMLYQEIARHVGARIVLSERASVGLPNISISDD